MVGLTGDYNRMALQQKVRQDAILGGLSIGQLIYEKVVLRKKSMHRYNRSLRFIELIHIW